jgi:hypothetical protein
MWRDLLNSTSICIFFEDIRDALTGKFFAL